MYDYTIIICTISIFHCVNLSIITSYAIISSSNTIMICTVTDNFGKREVYTVCSSWVKNSHTMKMRRDIKISKTAIF